jgi:hypothetical protein
VGAGKGNVKPRFDVAPNVEPKLCLRLASRLAPKLACPPLRGMARE